MPPIICCWLAKVTLTSVLGKGLLKVDSPLSVRRKRSRVTAEVDPSVTPAAKIYALSGLGEVDPSLLIISRRPFVP